ncbi:MULTISPECIES: ComEA family DNA-binding protein [Micrococcales]|uniref:ComEA family DNA-binding protein n=1 Tax=Micrococcales TaxID=85006 RepID=UPI001F1A1E91|nr:MULTISPECIES: ComEA family DNA-binding protein [Micrococcales]
MEQRTSSDTVRTPRPRVSPGRRRAGSAAGRERLDAMMERSRRDLGVSDDPLLVSRGELPTARDHHGEETSPVLSRLRTPGPEGSSARWRGLVPSPRAALALVALFAVVVLGAVVFQSQGREAATVAVQASGSTIPWESLAASSGAPAGASAGEGEEVVVHVVGAVKTPGLVRLPRGSLVNDAIQAAGGASETARLEGINLAEVLVSGRQVRVPSTDEASGPTESAGSSGTPGDHADTGKININSASAEDLQRLPKVGPKLAQRIIEWRTQHGPFHSADELDAVPGIGPGLLASLEPLVTW